MSDPFQVLPWEVVRDIFTEEVEYLKVNRWKFAQQKADVFVALHSKCFSLHHLDQIRRMIETEKAEIQKKLEEEQRRSRNPAALTGSGRGF
jgi:hypothetical protein